MRQRKHRHKESFSILLISNTGQNARHFHVGASFFRLLTVFILCAFAAFGWLAYHYLSASAAGVEHVNASGVTRESELLDQVVEQEKTIRQMETEKESLNRRIDELTLENKALLAAAKASQSGGTEDRAAAEEAAESDPAVPSRYPYSETGEVLQKYSESYPYVSINTRERGSVIAAGDGTVTFVGSEEGYPLVVEIEHGNGYRTRYMLPQTAEALCEEGEQVQAGDALVRIGGDNLRMDYQVIREGKPIDPLIVFEAKG